jgi:hypothetical protein
MFSESLEGYSTVMNAGAERLLARLGRAAAKGQEIDVWRYLGGLTMDVVGTASFGCVCSALCTTVLLAAALSCP